MDTLNDQNRITASGPGFAPVPLRLLADEQITDPETIAVYSALASFINYGTGDCFPSHATIAKRARCDESTVKRRIDLLCSLGYVQKVSGKATGKPNTYHLADAWGRSEGVAPGRARGSSRESYRVVPGGATNETHLNETQERGEEHAPASSATAPAAAAPTPEPSPSPAESFPEKMAQKAGKPTDSRFISKIGGLLLRASQEEIEAGLSACLTKDPGKVFYFADDFDSKWRPRQASTAGRIPMTTCPACRSEYQTARGRCNYCEEHPAAHAGGGPGRAERVAARAPELEGART